MIGRGKKDADEILKRQLTYPKAKYIFEKTEGVKE